MVVFLIGTMMGSAANALIDRLPKNISWAKGRSKCDTCGHELNFWDLVPVLSYIFIRGKCRYCHSPIPVRNLFVELITGIGFLLIFNSGFMIYQSLLLLGVLWATVIIAVMDWETMLVADIVVAVWGVLTLVIKFQTAGFRFFDSILGFIIAAGLIGGVWLFSKGRAMGSGDIGIAAVMGWWLGWPKIAAGLWIAFVVGAAYGLWLIVSGKKKLKSEMPFGPFLILGAWIGWMWGEKLVGMIL